jgi:ribonuclease-3
LNLSRLEQKLGVTFRDKNLLRRALTHRSYLRKNPSWNLGDNERLEFLGDSVLGLAVTEYLYKKYPDRSEGELSKLKDALVSNRTLGEISMSMGLGKHMLFAEKNGDEKPDTVERYAHACVFEAVLGAIYLDNRDSVYGFLHRFLLSHEKEIVQKNGVDTHPKTELNLIMSKRWKCEPIYRVIEITGTVHTPAYRVGVYLGEKLLAEGNGKSKKAAEKDAAGRALLIDLQQYE